MSPLAQARPPNCFAGPTRHNDFYQNYKVENRCGVTISIPVSVEIDGKIENSRWSIRPCSYAEKGGSKSWKYTFGDLEWEGIADSKSCLGPLKKSSV
jgi:hypothetical protein